MVHGCSIAPVQSTLHPAPRTGAAVHNHPACYKQPNGPGLWALWANFAMTEFSEVEHAFPAKTLMNSAVGQPLGEQFLRTLGPPASFIS